MKLQLVSFKLCPYVQRSVITLNYKKAKYDITYIDLENPPEWFDKASPLGKVPIMIVDDKTVLFESAVINEFIDEIYPPQLLPKDPLKRAYERAWIEYGSELFMSLYQTTMAESAGEFNENKKELFEGLLRLNEIKDASGPYFRGREFSLVDTSYAPLFMRLFLSDKLMSEPAWKDMPLVRRWGETLLGMDAVKNSVVPDFKELWLQYVTKAKSLAY